MMITKRERLYYSVIEIVHWLVISFVQCLINFFIYGVESTCAISFLSE